MRVRALGALALAGLAACRSAPPDAGDSRIATVEAFLAARAEGDLEKARAYMSADPRVWYDSKQGDGSPWNLAGGRWSVWDEHFRGSSEHEGWHVEGDAVWADFLEHNDYFRLTERGPGWYRATYFFDGEGLLAGLLIGAAPGREKPQGRRAEFEAWAREHRPDEAEYLMPGGAIDPTGDRAPRMRALLEEWRASVGLPAIE